MTGEVSGISFTQGMLNDPQAHVLSSKYFEDSLPYCCKDVWIHRPTRAEMNLSKEAARLCKLLERKDEIILSPKDISERIENAFME